MHAARSLERVCNLLLGERGLLHRLTPRDDGGQCRRSLDFTMAQFCVCGGGNPYDQRKTDDAEDGIEGPGTLLDAKLASISSRFRRSRTGSFEANQIVRCLEHSFECDVVTRVDAVVTCDYERRYTVNACGNH